VSASLKLFDLESGMVKKMRREARYGPGKASM
jgi:hypothetical protein